MVQCYEVTGLLQVNLSKRNIHQSFVQNSNAMKKVIPMTWLKAITTLYFLLISLFTSSAQQGNWEIGIGLRPLNLRDEPYSLNAKWHFTNRFALRLGLGVLYNEHDEFVSYLHPYYVIDDTTHKFAYEYTKVEKNFYANFFVGVQYLGTKIKNLGKPHDLDWYVMSDFFLKYRREEIDLPEGIYYPGYTILRRGELFTTAVFGTNKDFIIGIRQGIGIQYWVNRSLTITLEGGGHYAKVFSSAQKNTFETGRTEPPYEDGTSFGSARYAIQKSKDYQWGINPVMFLSFNYHF